MSQNWRRLLGLQNATEDKGYQQDPVLGWTSEQRQAERWVKSTCGYCSVGCGMELGVSGDRIVAVKGWDNHGANLGKLCPKGLAEHHILTSPNRLLVPQRQESNQQWNPLSWDDAFALMASRFASIADRFGPQAVAVISTGQLLTEEFYTLGKLVQLGLRTNNYCGNTTLCMASAVSGYKRSFGSDGPPGCYEDFELADVVLLIGANIADNHPVLCQRLEANRHKHLVVIDPRVSKTAMLADTFLPIQPRTDIALLNAMAHVILREGLANTTYIEQHTTGIDELWSHLAAYSPESVSSTTGLSITQIETVARRYATAKRALIAWTMGVNHSTQGAETVNAINNLALLTGHIGKPGSSPFSLTGQCNAMGTREVGFTSSIPGYRKFESPADRQEFASLIGVDPNEIPTSRGLAYPDLIEAAAAGTIKAIWFIATNPVVSFPNQTLFRQARKNLEFLVVQDGFHTETTAIADLVLPAASWGEKSGVYTNSERRISRANQAVPPAGQARSDFDIFLGFAKHLGVQERLFPGWTKPGHAWEEIRRVTAGRLCDVSGMSYELMEASGGLQWPHRRGDNPLAPKRLYEDGQFPTSDGRARLLPIHWQAPPEPTDRAFPFILNTGRTVEHWHTRSKTGHVASLENMAPNAWLEMNPQDAARLSMKSHERVTITSRRGQVAGVELRLTQMIAPGQLFMPFHFAEANVNEVTLDAFDPISREPNYKQCAVRVARDANSNSLRSKQS